MDSDVQVSWHGKCALHVWGDLSYDIQIWFLFSFLEGECWWFFSDLRRCLSMHGFVVHREEGVVVVGGSGGSGGGLCCAGVDRLQPLA